MIATTTSTGHRTDDPALLMLTGWCDDRAQFDELLVETGRCRRTVTMDWRGHGGSAPANEDFGTDDLVADALSVISQEGLGRVVPVAVSHAGWVALELRRRLGARVPAVVLVDWMVLGPPPGFTDALAALQRPDTWRDVRDQLFALWTEGVDHPAVLAVRTPDGGPRPRDVGAGRPGDRRRLRGPARTAAGLRRPGLSGAPPVCAAR